MKTVVPFLDLQAEYRALRPEVEAAVARVFDSTQFILGAEVAAFEAEFAAYCQAPHAIAVNSGTSALHLALLAAGIGPGDEVITTPFTFFATVAAIEYAGATPVLADIRPGTFNLDPARVESAITERTRAILPVHLYGLPAAMDELLALARRYKLTVIEDAAQAHGARYRGRPVGTLGDLGCFSFYPTKNLGAPGEGGMVVTRDRDLAARVRQLRDWGQASRYWPVVKGYNYRMQGLQAAVLRVKLEHLEAGTERRRAHAALYDTLLAGVPGLQTPEAPEDARHVYHLYTVRAEARDALRDYLNDHGIGTAIHYPAPIHLLPAYRDPHYGPGSFPIAEGCSQDVLSLPVGPHLELEQIETVARLVAEAPAGLSSHGCVVASNPDRSSKASGFGSRPINER